MNTGDFLNKLAAKVGIKADDKRLIGVLSKSEYSNTDIPDEIVNLIDTGLLTLDAAKAHPDVVKKIKGEGKGEALNGADKAIEKVLESLGYDAELLTDVRADKNTYTKIEKLAGLIKTAEGKKAGAKAPEVATLTKEIETANGKIRDMVSNKDKEIDAIKKTHESEINDYELRAMVATKKLNLPDDMDPMLKQQIALTAVKAELAKQGLQIVNNNGQREIKKADGTDAYDASSRKIDLTSLIDGALAQNKLTVVNDTTAGKTPAGQTIITNGGTQPLVNPNVLSQIDQDIADASRVTG